MNRSRLPDFMDNQASSIRFLGDINDYEKDTITFYEGPRMSGIQQMVDNDKEHLFHEVTRPRSMVITGCNTAWTLYPEFDFQGPGQCVGVNPDPDCPPVKSIIFQDVTDMPVTSVKSVKKGC